jgi:probable F420-dependent oxidoreductase
VTSSPALGRYGAWLNPVYDDQARIQFAVEVEQLGYGTVWLGLGQRDESDLSLVEHVLAATERVVVSTAIVNVWSNEADRLAASFRRIEARYPKRLLLGIGIGHRESVGQFDSPYEKLTSFLDVLDAAGVPTDRRVLAALGLRSLQLAARRSRGTHPYLTVPAHTRMARQTLGPDALLAPEQTVAVVDDLDQAREIGRTFVSEPYLRRSNYTKTMLRNGYEPSDVAGRGSDRLIDDLVLHGTAARVAEGLQQHIVAGADHVAIQSLQIGGDGPMPGLRELASALSLLRCERLELPRMARVVERSTGGEAAGWRK